MKKHVEVWWLTVLLAALLTLPAHGEEEEDLLDEELDFLVEELFTDKVEAVSKFEQSIMWSPSAVTVITREQIRASGATSIPDLLRRVPNFDVYQVKPSYTLVGARSRTTRSNVGVLLLIDGREDIQELTGFAFWHNLTIDLEEIERIEIIRGPGSALYGANAFSAVVSITTVSASHQKRAEVLLSGGETGQQRQFALYRNGTSLGDGTLSYGIGLGTETMLSPTDSRDVVMHQVRAHGYLRYQLEDRLDLSLHAGYLDGRSLFLLFVGDMRTPTVKTPWAMAKVSYRLSDDFKLSAQFYYNGIIGVNEYRIGLRALGLWLADIPTIHWNSTNLDGQVQLEYEILDDLLVMAGGNLRYSLLSAEGLILDTDHELRGAGFVQLQYRPLSSLQMVAGVRVDYNSATKTAVSPRAAMVFRPWPNHAFRLGYGLAFRKPSFFESQVHIDVQEYNEAFKEIVDTLGTQVGNPALRNETVHSFELGWKTNLLDDRLDVSVDLFYNFYRDFIDFTAVIPIRMGLPDIKNSELMFSNREFGVNTLGGEAEVVFRPDLKWTFWANVGLRRAAFTGPYMDFYSYRETEGRDVQEPRLRVNLGGSLNPPKGLVASVSVHYVSSTGWPEVEPDDQVKVSKTTWIGDNFLLLGRAGYRFSFGRDYGLEAGFTARTPLGAVFTEHPGTSMPLYIESDTRSDFGGEPLVRLVSFYLRGSF